MIILNDERFCDEIFYEVQNREEIKESPNNSTLIFEFKNELIDSFKFCRENNIDYAVKIQSVVEAVFAMNLGAKYLFVSEFELAKKVQKIATEYLSDTKVIFFIGKYDENIMEISALNGIDGVFL